MNLSKRNFKLSKRTLFVFKNQSGRDGLFISADPSTVFGPTATNSGAVPKNNA
ncbi:hypothetical protein OQY15_13145 [Pedobacter sp. MC2016-15]|uniref:hypothetical protein n=1 Tax=Pedobacter sp. MC2016-15 TaxID=2994473 RepID=UPI0022485EC3|nr:hypothetical protein [Pedobacter sp. MC2016-15]MCX2480039.1 hypothetical protein [Pedobacter sp. MC2016-15]